MRTHIGLGFLALVIVFAAGCATSRVETDYGTSNKLARFNQTLNPDAEKNLQPVEGMDGQASQKALDTYRKGFEKPAQAMPSLVIGVSGSGK